MRHENAVRLWFGIGFIILGIALFLGKVQATIFGSMPVGAFALYVGIVAMSFAYIREKHEEKRVDERDWHIAYHASRATFIAVVFGAFLLMVVDSFVRITWPYTYSMAFGICGMMVIYTISYKIIEKRT